MHSLSWSSASQDSGEQDKPSGKEGEDPAADEAPEQLGSEEEVEGEAATNMEYQEPIDEVRPLATHTILSHTSMYGPTTP